MVGAEKGVGRSCIVDEDHRSVLRGDGNVDRFFFTTFTGIKELIPKNAI